MRTRQHNFRHLLHRPFARLLTGRDRTLTHAVFAQVARAVHKCVCVCVCVCVIHAAHAAHQCVFCMRGMSAFACAQVGRWCVWVAHRI
eukprot:14489541-Alexandrium_andersonii.AAC.1